MISNNYVPKNFHRLLKRSPPMRGVFPAQEQMMQQARALLHAEEAKGLGALVARKTEDMRLFDVAGMERAVAIIACGRSGADLLYSYLDGHEDVLMLPPVLGDRIYQFYERYRSLSLHDKLIAYPVFSADLVYSDFFHGAFPIVAADYYAAVKALFKVHGNWPPESMESRRAFFQFLHVVYCVARHQRPASPHPLIVYAQHAWSDHLAESFVEDFPQAQFIHTVRDPLTNCSRSFENRFNVTNPDCFLTAAFVIWNVIQRGIPHHGMESRTVAVRFEDLHLHLEKTMRAVADCLGLSYRSSLLESTFNGAPWVVGRKAISWSGARPEQAARDLQYISFTDKCLLFALLNECFVCWSYPCPKLFKHVLVRGLTCVLGLLIPTKMEIVAARAFIGEILSSRCSGFRYAIKGSLQILICRLTIVLVIALGMCRLLPFGKRKARLSVIKVFET